MAACLTFFLALPPDPAGLSFLGFDVDLLSCFLGGCNNKNSKKHFWLKYRLSFLMKQVVNWKLLNRNVNETIKCREKGYHYILLQSARDGYVQLLFYPLGDHLTIVSIPNLH